ncbi:pentatricopeptide repeat-containing protein At5g06540-like [Syzygium oleosum]|uniref:pentatricopeptide repeat-containing protein At5g06540-like n=1 Tax=Syzygium oleosum TaxID=219896 RepID=UPI0011D27E5B|nr:pentatricopeptide repeat-containing protein At5g06540-like [Syzygium oleosum]XP_056170031.1 pentatricopeptide repeat-containing protein At5g06540-like [Syzygium oleosum]XP_056170035.1 pentatricopeptide repeat-containing protein At5g06540-like [Syzygium oleosum]XP_056170040.1 pentatricopeptide repeat-containing protein At5g06540-like [Syzygium oleosum]XP_056170042.1 pentatricopeptide repeat-containing protein At5g06540-like [Syzygium oleosum]XP_056170044.1 pentatricopeptide repeat-containing
MASNEAAVRALQLLHHQSLSQALNAFTRPSHLRQAHAHLVVAGLTRRLFTATRLLACAAISALRDLPYAEAMFRRVEAPTFFMYNTMIRAFSECPGHDCLEGVAYYVRMLRNGVFPDNFTHPFVLRSCSLSSQLLLGRQVHAHVVKFGSGRDIYVVNNMLSMYSSCREMGNARHLFEECSGLVDVVSWTSLVTGYVKAGDIDVAQSYFERMPRRNVVSWNAMISGYARSGRISDARKLFDMMPERDVSSWSAMISGYVQCKMCADALGLFKEMVGGGIVANEAAVVSAVSACAQLRAIDWGTWLHEYTVEHGFEMNVILGTALVDMHGKCGNVAKAVEVFNLMPERNVCSWNSMIASLALNARGKQALSLFWQMQRVGHTPNHITFTAVLSGCSHSGLVKEGRQIFSLMTEEYQLEPWSEHYGSMVDLLGRAGLIREAVEFVKGMHIEPHPGLWGALVAACKIHGEIELGKQLGKHLIDLEPDHGGRYALLSDLFASVERWDDVELVRNSFVQRKVLKAPGNSIIEL